MESPTRYSGQYTIPPPGQTSGRGARLEHMEGLYRKAFAESNKGGFTPGSVAIQDGAVAQAQTDSVTEQRRQTEEAYARGELTDEDYDAAMDEFDRAEEERIGRSGEKYSFGGPQKNTAESGVTGKRKKNLGMEASEIQAVQSIGRKSVNAFTSADIQKTEGLARRYWTEMREKSPFFRAWFGDWRVNDQTPVLIANKTDDTRGIQRNEDTGWDIQVSGKIFAESQHFANKNTSAIPFLPYINDIINKAVLLDSYGVSKGKSVNSLLMHSLYAVADVGNGPELLKLYVEEMNNPNQTNTAKRAYQLQNIEKASAVNGGVQGNTPSSLAPTTNAIRTVADLFAAVKQKDSSFNPKPVSKIVNEDGTPMILYHGTSDHFTQFKDTEISPREGSFFFAQNREDAEAYSGNGTIMEVYVSLKNPIDYNDMPSEIYRLKDKKAQVDALKKLGYDGWYCDMDTGWGEVSAFYPEQIKSATDNIGTFDDSNPDIRYSLSSPKVKEQGRPLEGWYDSDEKQLQAKKAGYPVLKGEQVVPYATWVRSEERGNYGLVTGKTDDGRLLVSFHNKHDGSMVWDRKNRSPELGKIEPHRVSGAVHICFWNTKYGATA